MFALTKKVWPMFLALGLGLALTSCEEKETPKPEPEPDPIETPTLTLNKTEVLAPKDGGSYSVEVSITNPIEGQSIEVTTPQVEWITDVDTSIENIIQFNVVANSETEVREATFTISYQTAEDVSFVVKQEAGDPIAFVYENLETTMNAFQVDVIPADKETPYIFFTADEAYIRDYGLEDDDALFEDDLAYFESMARYYGVSLAELLENIARVGDQHVGTNSLSPQTVYVGYAYHIDIEKQERLSEIIRLKVTTDSLPMTEVNFDVTIDVLGPNATAHVQPVDYDGYYHWAAIDAAKFEESYPDGNISDYVIQSWVNTVDTYLYYGYSVDYLLGNCFQGEQSIKMENMTPNTDYIFAVFAINETTAYPNSAATTQDFTTQDIPESDLVVEITVKEVKSRSCVVDFIASNDTDPYFGSVLDKAYYESFGATDEERLAYIEENFYLFTSTGSRYDQLFEELQPETEYVALAFGYIGRTINTQCYKVELCTTAAEDGQCVVTMNMQGYYDSQAVAALDESFTDYASENTAFVPCEILIEPDSDTFYYAIYEDDGETTDEEWLEYLISNGKKTNKEQAYVLDYNFPLIFVGFAVDANGNYDPLCKHPFTLVKEEVSDPQEFLEWYYALYGEAPRREVCSQENRLEPAAYAGNLIPSDRPIVREQQTSQSGRLLYTGIEKLEHTQSQRKVQFSL